MTATTRTAAVARRAPRQTHGFRVVARRVLRDQRRSPLTWGIPLGLLSALEVAIYPSVHKSLGKAVDSYPDALKEAFRIETIDTPAKFLNGEMFSLLVPLAIGFFAIRAASRPIVGYEERRWLDVVLAVPVRRQTLVAGAFAATAVSSAAILTVMCTLIWIAGQVFGAEIAVGDLAGALVGTWAFAALFAGLALAVSGRIGNWTAVTGIATGLLVGSYVIDVVSRVADGLRQLGKISPFHWYGSPLLDGVGAGHLGLALTGVLLAVVGALLFERRDVHG